MSAVLESERMSPNYERLYSELCRVRFESSAGRLKIQRQAQEHSGDEISVVLSRTGREGKGSVMCKREFTSVTISFRANICSWVKETVGTQEFGSFLIAVVIVSAV